MTNKKYNGWTNYETWAVALWINNEEGSQRYWRMEANETIVTAVRSYSSETQNEAAQRELADALKQHHEENIPEFPCSVYSDLLGAALSEVNWYEIAGSLLEDVEVQP